MTTTSEKQWGPERAAACAALIEEHFLAETSTDRRLEILREMGLASPSETKVQASCVVLRVMKQADGTCWCRIDGQHGPVAEYVLPPESVAGFVARAAELAYLGILPGDQKSDEQ